MSRPRLGLIAYEYPPLVGGMATYARALARHMHEAGYDVHVFANEKATGEGDGIAVHPILTTDLARDLPRLMGHKADLWHAINFGYAPLACVRRPFVLTVHGTDFLTPWVRWKMDRVPMGWRFSDFVQHPTSRRLLSMPALRCVDEILTCSRFSARCFREEYPVVGKVTVIPNGVEKFFLTPFLSVRHPRRVLTVCNLDVANRRKNVEGCLRALALVGDRLNLDYWIVGDGPLRGELQALAEHLGVTHRVSFKGCVSREELLAAYASSSLFTLVPKPQSGDVEGFGIVYLEAAACGTPSLAGRYGGAVDAIAEGESGFFADSESPEAIAGAWTRFFTGNIRLDEAAIRAHAHTFTWSTVLKRVEDVYGRHLRQSPPARPRESQPKKKTILHTAPRGVSAETRDWSTWIRQPVKQPPATGRGGRVLLISYMFPPTGGSAVQRPAKLAKYLPECGWEVEVLTAGHERFPWKDATLLNDLPDAVIVHRVAGYEPANLARRLAGSVTNWLGLKAGHRARTVESAGCRQGCPHHNVESTDAPAEGMDLPGTTNMDVGRAASRDARENRAMEASGLPDTGDYPGDRHGGRSSRWMEDRLYWRLTGLTQKLGAGQGEALWIAPAVSAALRQHRFAPFDAVISTGPPHFVHHVAWRFASQAGIPWLADLRDPLISDFEREPHARRHLNVMRRLERHILRHADAVITTCPSLVDDLVKRYPHRDPDSIVSITNGFDREDLARFADELPPVSHHGDCTFIAAGALYGRRELSRLIEPLERILARRPEWSGRVRFRLVGTLDGEQRTYWERHRPDWLELTGYLPHKEAVRSVLEADCAVVIVPDCRHGRLSIPGKTFELLALPTHLLALAPAGSDTAVIVSDVGAVTCTRFEDAAAIEAAMERIITTTLSDNPHEERNWSRVDRYDRRVIAHRFANLLSDATGQTKHTEDTVEPVVRREIEPKAVVA